MPENTNETRLVEVLTQSLFELLRELGGQPQILTGPRRSPPEGVSIAAFIGFGNADLRGAFSLFGSKEVFARLHPLPATDSSRDLVDWACELVNQSVGRFRNKMLSFNVTLAFSVPQSALAEQLRVSSSFDASRTPISFGIGDMVLETWVELDIKPTFRFGSGSSDKGPALEEGSMLLF